MAQARTNEQLEEYWRRINAGAFASQPDTDRPVIHADGQQRIMSIPPEIEGHDRDVFQSNHGDPWFSVPYMNEAEQRDLVCLLTENWTVIADAGPAGFPSVVSTELSSRIEVLRSVGIVNNELKVAADFLAVAKKVADGRDLWTLQTVDLALVAYRYAERYRRP